MPKVLIVEDEPDLLEIAAEMMDLFGFEVIQAEDGLQALERARAESPDVVLLDNRLVPNDPDRERLDGPEVARRLRAQCDRVIIVALTALAMPNQEREFKEAGIDLFVTKPVESYPDLVDRISVILTERRRTDG
jgi:CheY-like chemotaxis protein